MRLRNQKEESLKCFQHSKFQFQAEIRFTTVSSLAENNCFENTLKVTEEQRNEKSIFQHQRRKNFELSRFIPGPHKM